MPLLVLHNILCQFVIFINFTIFCFVLLSNFIFGTKSSRNSKPKLIGTEAGTEPLNHGWLPGLLQSRHRVPVVVMSEVRICPSLSAQESSTVCLEQ